jgi:uncharacterized protein YhjY with autotransporter beta-barrel domain/phospholipase/lecithinase/hemolysin
MRGPGSRAPARSLICAAVLAVVGLTTSATAQQRYDRLFTFGDSYSDVTMSNQLATNPEAQPSGFPVLQNGAGNWQVYPVPLADKLHIGTIYDFSVAGAGASPTATSPNPNIVPSAMLPGNLGDQVKAFENGGYTFGPNDLVTTGAIGGNDVQKLLNNVVVGAFVPGAEPILNQAAGYFPEPFLGNPAKFADKTAQYTVDEIGKLYGAGARNFVIPSFSEFAGLPVLQDNLAQVALVSQPLADAMAAGADAWAAAYFQGLQARLLPYAQDGGRFFLFDMAGLANAVQADPVKYGFTGGFRCPLNNCPDAHHDTTYYFGPDGLHLSDAGFALLAEYLDNVVMAPHTIAVQPVLVSGITGGFAQTVFGRLDGTRDARLFAGPGGSAAADGPSYLGAKDKPAPAPSGLGGRVTTYAMGTFGGGDRNATTDLPGYDYEQRSGTAGWEYSVNRNFIVGLAFNATDANAGLNDGAAADIGAFQAAAYLSYATKQVFADVLAAYGSHDVGIQRPGILDPVTSSTEASAYALAARGGYLFDLGGLRAGPVAGLTYVHARVDGYTESGDPLLTYNVSAQEIDSLTGNVGIRLLAPFKAGAGYVVPYLNVLLEHQLGDQTRTQTVDQVQTSLNLPIMTSFANFETRTYGRVDGGITFELAPDIGGTINAGSTFARDEGQDYRVSAGLNVKF